MVQYFLIALSLIVPMAASASDYQKLDRLFTAAAQGPYEFEEVRGAYAGRCYNELDSEWVPAALLAVGDDTVSRFVLIGAGGQPDDYFSKPSKETLAGLKKAAEEALADLEYSNVYLSNDKVLTCEAASGRRYQLKKVVDADFAFYVLKAWGQKSAKVCAFFQSISRK